MLISLAIIGLLAGLLGGLLGIGGSVVMIPAMTFVFGANQHLYQAAAMIVNFFVVLPSVYRHWRAGAIDREIVTGTIPASVVAVMVGVWLSSGSWFHGDGEIWLARIFGIFLLYAAAYNIIRLLRSNPTAANRSNIARSRQHKLAAATVGAPMGIVAGLLGIGGGSLAVPLQQVLLKVPLRRAIANSATTIVALSIVGATYKNISNAQAGIAISRSVLLAAGLVPTAIVGGFIGGGLVHVIPRRLLRVAVILLMCYGGIGMLAFQPRDDQVSTSQPAIDTLSPHSNHEAKSATQPIPPELPILPSDRH
jgi:hypothetical protein